jgi:four helix bundle protein
MSGCQQLQEAADAISANIADGFDRYRLPGFRYFLEIANGSLGETFTRLRQGFARGLFTERQFNELLVLCTRTRKLLTPLITSVEAQATALGKFASRDANRGQSCSVAGRTLHRKFRKDPTASVP